MSLSPTARLLLQAGGLGLASGGRSMAGLTGVATSTPAQATAPQPLAALSAPRGQRLTALLMLGELVTDKMPFAPSRTQPPVLATRALTGALSGYTLAQRRRVPVVLPALVGAAAAVAGSFIGLRWRRLAADRGWPDLPVALAEDAVVIGLAAAASRL